jgi:hypothetical protein
MSEDQGSSAVAEETEKKRPRKLIKQTDKATMSVSIEVVGVDSGPTEYSLAELNEDIIDALALHGLSQKLGDSAAGKDGQEALSSIAETWDNLKEGKFKGERAAGERMPTKKSMLAALEALPPEEQEASREALESLGIKL